MVDEEKIKAKSKAEIELLGKKISKIFNELTFIDGKRLEHIENYLKSESQLDNLLKFEKLTEESSSLMKEYENSFLKIVAFVLLAEDHWNDSFRLLFKRYKFMESLIKKSHKGRKKQIRISLSIIKILTGGRTFIPRRIQDKRLLSSLKEEGDLKLIIMGFYKKNEKTINLIHQRLGREKIKSGAVLALAGTAWLAPLVGTVLSAGILAAYSWANKHSENYKLLISLAA